MSGAAPLVELVPGRLWAQRSARWQTSTAIAARDGHALVCDPSWTPAEIALIAAHARAVGPAGVHVLVTHADEDHVCGLGALPEVEVIAGPATAALVADGTAAARLVEAEATWGLAWVGAPRVSRVVACGVASAGPFRLEAIEAEGHAADGTAWLLVDEGVLLPGDYLSAVSPPLVLGSVAGFRATLARLLALLDAGRATRVLPGHGPALDAAAAAVIARADIAYLDAVAGAAAAGVAAGAPSGEALVRARAAALLPRAPIDDLAIYDPRTTNARQAVDEALAAAGGDARA